MKKVKLLITGLVLTTGLVGTSAKSEAACESAGPYQARCCRTFTVGWNLGFTLETDVEVCVYSSGGITVN